MKRGSLRAQLDDIENVYSPKNQLSIPLFVQKSIYLCEFVCFENGKKSSKV